MYQKAVQIARIMSEIEIENRTKDQAKEEFSPGGSNFQGNRSFRRFKHGMKKDRKSKPSNGNRGNLLANLMKCVCNIS